MGLPEENSELQDVLSGKTVSDSNFVDYLANQYRGMRVEFEASDLAVRNLRLSLDKEIDRKSYLMGGLAKYKDDTAHWLNEHKKKKLVPLTRFDEEATEKKPTVTATKKGRT